MDSLCRRHFEWFDQYILPIVRAAVDQNEAGVSTACSQAQAAIEGSTISADSRLGLAIMVRYVCLVRYLAVGDRQHFVEQYDRVLNFIEASQSIGEDSDCVRRTTIMQLRILGALHGIAEMSQQQFRDLIATVPQSERWLEQWHYITSLAFLLGDNETVKAGYEAFLENHSDYQAGFLFRRYNVMNKIVGGHAQRIDALKLIEDATLPGHVREVAQVFWPRLMQAGLVDSELEEKLADKLAQICD